MRKLKPKLVVAGGNHVSWSDSYSMGIRLIDDQHKGLLNFVNDLFTHATGNEEEERIWFREVIQQAVRYINVHFSTEERFMRVTRFPGFIEHKKAHDDFKFTVVKSVKDFEAGKRLVLEKFAYFLKDWILTHVAVMDRQYSDYFRKIAIRDSDGKLVIKPTEAA